jgi:hypothetical protein
VDDRWLDLFMKVGEPIGNTNADLHSCPPV